MPPTEFNIVLTVGEPLPPPPPPIIIPEPEPEGLPTGRVYEFLMNGKMKIMLSKDIIFTKKDTEERLKMELMPGAYSDPALLKFDFKVTKISKKDIDVQFTFENPLQVS